MNNPLYDPQFLAGLAIASGTPANDALQQAALFQNEQQNQQMKQAEYQRKQYIDQALPQILSQLNDIPDPTMKLQALVEYGVPIQDAALILERIGAVGNNNINKSMEGIKNSSSSMPEPRKLSATELRTNSNTLRDLNNIRRNSEKELRLLEDSEQAFEDYDKNAGYFSEAGSLLSKIPLPKFAENLTLNESAQTAKQKIDKLNSQLFQNRVAGLGSRATDAAKAEILKGLPQTSLTRDARRDLLDTKKRENYDNILRAEFFDQWAKANGNDLNGAEGAYSDFINSVDLLDENGNVNKKLLKMIPGVVNGDLELENEGEDEEYTYEEVLKEIDRRKRKGR